MIPLTFWLIYMQLLLLYIDCAEKLGSALFMVGEIGGNDYNYAFFQGKSMEDVKGIYGAQSRENHKGSC